MNWKNIITNIVIGISLVGFSLYSLSWWCFGGEVTHFFHQVKTISSAIGLFLVYIFFFLGIYGAISAGTK